MDDLQALIEWNKTQSEMNQKYADGAESQGVKDMMAHYTEMHKLTAMALELGKKAARFEAVLNTIADSADLGGPWCASYAGKQLNEANG